MTPSHPDLCRTCVREYRTVMVAPGISEQHPCGILAEGHGGCKGEHYVSRLPAYAVVREFQNATVWNQIAQQIAAGVPERCARCDLEPESCHRNLSICEELASMAMGV